MGLSTLKLSLEPWAYNRNLLGTVGAVGLGSKVCQVKRFPEIKKDKLIIKPTSYGLYFASVHPNIFPQNTIHEMYQHVATCYNKDATKMLNINPLKANFFLKLFFNYLF